MITFADLEFYKTEYLQGDVQTIPDAVFPRLASKASGAINLRTSQRAETMGVITEVEEPDGNDNPIITEILTFPDEIKLCTCELAELYFYNEQASSPDAVRSMSIGSYSETLTDQRKQQAELNKEINEIFRRYLSDVFDGTGTPLLYRG